MKSIRLTFQDAKTLTNIRSVKLTIAGGVIQGGSGTQVQADLSEIDDQDPSYVYNKSTEYIEPTTERQYIDANDREVLDNTSGTNTGDQDLSGLQPLLTGVAAPIVSNKNLSNKLITIPFASNITIDARNGAIFEIGDLTSSITSLSLSNLTAGQTFVVIVKQDAVGGRTITFDSGVFENSFGESTINLMSSKISIISCVVKNNGKVIKIITKEI